MRTWSLLSPTSSPESAERIYSFLERHPVGVLATISPASTPDAVVIYFTVNDQFEFYFVTKTQTRKYKNMRLHPNVSLVSYDPFSQTTVQVHGHVEEVTSGAVKNSMLMTLEQLAAHGGKSHKPPISKLQAGRYAVLRLRPTSIRMANYMESDTSMYETIEFQYPESLHFRAQQAFQPSKIKHMDTV